MCSDTKNKNECDSKKECDWKPWYNVCKPTYECTRESGCAKKCTDKKENNCKSDPKCEWLSLDCNNVHFWAALEKIGKLDLCKSSDIIASNRTIKAYYCSKDKDSKSECDDYEQTHIGFDISEEQTKTSTDSCTGIICDDKYKGQKNIKIGKPEGDVFDLSSLSSTLADNYIISGAALIFILGMLYYQYTNQNVSQH
jgi:hypothetical protein